MRFIKSNQKKYFFSKAKCTFDIPLMSSEELKWMFEFHIINIQGQKLPSFEVESIFEKITVALETSSNVFKSVFVICWSLFTAFSKHLIKFYELFTFFEKALYQNYIFFRCWCRISHPRNIFFVLRWIKNKCLNENFKILVFKNNFFLKSLYWQNVLNEQTTIEFTN